MTEELLKKNGGNARVCGSRDDSVRIVVEMSSQMKKLTELAKQSGYKLSMDESRLCAECGKGKKVDLVLVTVDADGKEARTSGFNPDDVIYLSAFFKGMDYYGDGVDTIYPLKGKAGRIEELLGLKLEK